MKALTTYLYLSFLVLAVKNTGWVSIFCIVGATVFLESRFYGKDWK